MTGLYVHVPFCFHKCHYCDFYSITRQADGRMAAFVDRLLGEAAAWRGPTRFDTVFVGGGTPTLLPVRDLRRLLRGLRETFDLTGVREWTVEVNPATADADYLAVMRESGVDRVSVGAQSFDPAALRLLERHHDPDDVGRTIDAARDVGIGRRSVDLIFAVPGQTAASWEATLDAALTLDVDHMSCYGLTYEPNTPLAVRRRLGRVTAVAEEAEVALYRLTRDRLRAAGFRRYEVSNYARTGAESRHNLAYWDGRNYLGLGPSAASHVGGARWRNAPHLGRWEAAVDAGRSAAVEVERLDADARARELAWLRLRTAAGIDMLDFEHRTGLDPLRRFADAVERTASAGLVEVADGHLRLTGDAWHLADAVAEAFLGS